MLIDGVPFATVNVTLSVNGTRPFAATGLGEGPHVLQIRKASGNATVDGFRTPGTPAVMTVAGPSAADLSVTTAGKIDVVQLGLLIVSEIVSVIVL